MLETSHAQYDATVSGTIPDLEFVAEGIWALPVPVTSGSVPYSICYLVRDSENGIHVIDPGFHSDDNWGSLAFALSRIGSSRLDVASIIVTHLHPDHVGMAQRLHKTTGAPIIMHRTEAEDLVRLGRDGVPNISARLDGWGTPTDRQAEIVAATTFHYREDVLTATPTPIDDGDRLDIPGRDIRAVHMPGHTPGHLGLRFVDERLLVTGDHILPNSYPDLSLRGADGKTVLARYLDSLERLSELDDYEVLPGHGYRFTGLAGRCDRITHHHLRRIEAARYSLVARPDQTLWEVAKSLIWTGGWENRHGFYLLVALRETAMYVDYLAARVD